MKKNLCLLAVMIFSLASMSFAQELISEDFSGGVMPPEGWTIDAHSVNWDISSSNKAGCDAPEAKMKYSPAFNGTSRLISPVIDASGYEHLSIKLNYFVDHYDNSYKIGVAVRNGEGAWNKIWEQNISNDVPATQKIILVDNAGEDNTAFQYCFFFEGNSYNFDNIYLDNFTLFNADNLDFAVKKIDMLPYVEQGNVDIKAIFANQGINEITSFTVNWQEDGGEIHSQDVNQSIPSFEFYQFTFSEQWNATPGNHMIKVWVSEVNNTMDDNEDNNEQEKNINVATQTVGKKLLIEEFTSSTCGPCAGFNGQFEPWANQHEDVIIVKYQMNWPGNGDAYYTEEGGVRRNYYGVSGVPMIAGNGSISGASMAAVNNFYDNSLNEKAFFKLEGTHELNDKVISGQLVITPYLSLSEVTLHVVVVEKTTTGNVGTNGESSFKQVMMKMIPNAEGTTLNLSSEVPYYHDFEMDLSSTNIEEYDDLEVIAFLQFNNNKEVLQSAVLPEGDAPTPPAPIGVCNIEEGASNVSLDTEFTITFDQPIRALDNSELTNENIDEHIIFTGYISLKDDIVFDATINENKTVITIIPETNLYGYFCTLGMDATVENYYDVPIIPFELEFGMEGIATSDVFMDNLQVYPNPAKENTYLNFEVKKSTDVTIEIYQMNGQLMHQQMINQAVGKQSIEIMTNNYEKGVYLCKLKAGKHTKNIKLVVM